MPRLPQVQLNIPLAGGKAVPAAVLEEADRLNEELEGRGRVLVRPSGTEPLLRVLAEAETVEEAKRLSGSIAALVQRELG
jgi:phosphoglucosamine mutase